MQGVKALAKAPVVKTEDEAAAPPKATCGIIMPIAGMPPVYDAKHWSDVRKVIDAAIQKADMVPQIVSDSFESDVIQRRIISNLYENPVVVCDVSGLNPNVMFELGMRLTFKMPVVIITDDYATIPFDTKVIEHLGYPRDLRIHETNEFIDKLADRIKLLHKQKTEDTFVSFIEAFGTFEVLEPTKKVVESDQFILDEMKELSRAVRSLTEKRGYSWHPEAQVPALAVRYFDIRLNAGAGELVAKNITRVLMHNFPQLNTEVRRGKLGEITVRVNAGVSGQEQRLAFAKDVMHLLNDDLMTHVTEMVWSA